MSQFDRPERSDKNTGSSPAVDSARSDAWGSGAATRYLKSTPPHAPSLIEASKTQFSTAAMTIAAIGLSVAVKKPGLLSEIEEKIALGTGKTTRAADLMAKDLRGSSSFAAMLRETTPLSATVNDAASGLRLAQTASGAFLNPGLKVTSDFAQFAKSKPALSAERLITGKSFAVKPVPGETTAAELKAVPAIKPAPPETVTAELKAVPAIKAMPTETVTAELKAVPAIKAMPTETVTAELKAVPAIKAMPTETVTAELKAVPAIKAMPTETAPAELKPVNAIDQSAANPLERAIPSERLRAAPEPGNAPVHGYRFVHIKADDPVIPHFDIGVNLKDKTVLGNAENMQGHNASDALSALWWPTAKLPKEGVTLAVEKQTPDSFTALAVLANRIEKRKVSEAIVKAVAKSGHDVNDQSSLAAFKAIAHLTEEPGIKLGDRLRGIRSILDGTASAKTIDERAAKFDALRNVPVDASREVQKTGVRGLSSAPQFEYRQPSTATHANYDFAIGTRDIDVIGKAKVIDQEGATGIIERALRLPLSELPRPGASIVMPQTDVSRVTAAAILEARVASAPMRVPLLDLIQREARRGSSQFSHSERAMEESFARVPEAVRTDVVAAWKAIEGVASDPILSARRKVAAVTNLLTTETPAYKLAGIAKDFNVFRPSEQPFKYVRTTEFKPKNYDYGVEITNEKLRNGQPNLDHHGAGTSLDTLSASEQAIRLPMEEVPQFGARVAIQKPDADAITAVAVLANRRAGLAVNPRVVDAVGRLDRGFTTDEKGMPFSDVETSLNAIRSIARNANIPINQRITATRAILSGDARREDIIGIADNYKRNKWMHDVHTEKTSAVTDIIPGHLTFIETDKKNWFHARKLGTDRAPVAVIAAKDERGTHFEVVARAGHPDAAKLANALDALSKMENGWAGRTDIFVSSGSSSLSSEEVLKVIGSYLK